MKEVGIYVHIPFCKSRCIYCDFASTTFSYCKQNEYTEALCLEIEKFGATHAYGEIVADTIYFGGGTPSVLAYINFKKIVDTLKKNIVCQLKEFSVEVNPCSASDELFASYKSCGVTRISFGAQTQNNDILKFLGRRHTAEEAISAVDKANDCGFNVSVDMMLGLPNQTEKDVQDFVSAYAGKVGHVSTYMLNVEENTPLFDIAKASPDLIPTEEKAVDMYECAYAQLLNVGYKRYEVSNFAMGGKQCKHNLKYWRAEDYVGFGLSAHSLLDGVRYFNTANFDEYMLKANNLKTKKENNKAMREKEQIQKEMTSSWAYVTEQVLTDEDKLEEKIMLGLRLEQGLDVLALNNQFAIDFLKKYEKAIKKCASYLNIAEDNVAIKSEYFNVMNAIILEFLD